MARVLGDVRLQTREARRKLGISPTPHWRSLERGRSLGYRRNASGGAWIARLYVGAGKYIEHRLGSADDTLESDGREILSWSEAQRLAHDWFARCANEGETRITSDRITVDQSLNSYLDWYKAHRKAHADTKYNIEANIRPALGSSEIRRLTKHRIEAWHRDLAALPARIRTRAGAAQKFAPEPGDADTLRSRKVTANRNLSILKAALNRSHEELRLTISPVWTRVAAFKNVARPRARFLEHHEAIRLVNACDPAFRLLVQAALLTGARYGELVRLRVEDYRQGKLLVRDSKANRARWIALAQDGAKFFAQLTAGRSGGELIFLKPSRFENDAGERISGWGKNHQQEPMRAACEQARISSLGFHQLRHTYASLCLMSGMPLIVLSRNLGHSDTRMVERHYGHLLQSYEDQMIEAHAPKFGFSGASNVVMLNR
jgi:integrase